MPCFHIEGVMCDACRGLKLGGIERSSDLERLTIDRDEWREQHERLLVMYQAEVQKTADLTRLAEERLAHAHQLQADWDAEMEGRLRLRRLFGARDDETMGQWLDRLEAEREGAGVVPVSVHERGGQWRPVGCDTAFAPPFGTIRVCRACGCLVAGGPNCCGRCAAAEVAKP